VHAALEQWRAQPDDLADWIASGAWAMPRRRRLRCVPPAVAMAYRQLGLAPGASPEQVIAARRHLARRHHPDTGGQHAAMVAINTATDTVTGWLSRRG
jgi:DnaJ-class molecular chaperone